MKLKQFGALLDGELRDPVSSHVVEGEVKMKPTECPRPTMQLGGSSSNAREIPHEIMRLRDAVEADCMSRNQPRISS
jgi:hypothetical protein